MKIQYLKYPANIQINHHPETLKKYIVLSREEENIFSINQHQISINTN